MTNLPSLVCTLMVTGSLVLAVGCGGGGGGSPADGGGADAPSCSSGDGGGTLAVRITGAPTNGGEVSVANLAAVGMPPQTVAADMDISTAAGAHSITAARVAGPGGGLTRTAYEPSPAAQTACVSAGQTATATVAYAPIASSNKLWVGNSAANKAMLGFAPEAIAATGAPAATVVADTGGSDGFAFDVAGNLWVLGATTVDAPLARYAAATLGTSGAKTPDVTIDSPSFRGGLPGPKVVAFDAVGNMWVSVVFADKVVRFTPAQLAAGGMPTAAVEIGGIAGPSGIAFDAAGNLWVASNGDATVVRVNAARLAASGTGADVAITAETPLPVIGPLPAPRGIAFDAAGNLWAAFDVTIVRLTPADQAGTGPKTVTPAIQINVGVASVTAGIAFDDQGGLWVALGAGKFGRLAPTQLAASSAEVTPATIISSPDVAYADWFAIYPAPAATPLASRLP